MNSELEIIRFIKIQYAHEHTANDYKYEIENQSEFNCENGTYRGVIEIGMVRQNPLILKYGNGQHIIAGENDIFIIPPDMRFDVIAKEKGIHRHITTEAVIDYKRACESSIGRISLPLLIKHGHESEKIAEIIKKIVVASTSLRSSNYFGQCGDYMRLLSEISKYTSKKDALSTIPPSCRLYCDMAEKYAMDNISRHIRVEEIAAHIGISKNYLTNIFSRYKGMPISEYINRIKLKHMLELMLRFGYNVREAGEYIGIDNVNYISRMFKKYYNMTLSEYRQLNF